MKETKTMDKTNIDLNEGLVIGNEIPLFFWLGADGELSEVSEQEFEDLAGIAEEVEDDTRL